MDGGDMKGTVRRIGVMGGSFDPVHLGHLIAAQDAFEFMELDEVVFMPASIAPLKDRKPVLNDSLRLKLLQAAVDGDPRFSISTFEIDRGGVSYSVDTAREMTAMYPGCRLFWIIGADQARQIADWAQIEDLGKLVEFIVLARPGSTIGGTPPPNVRMHVVEARLVNISSSEIRERLAADKPTDFFLPAAVAGLIEHKKLYR
jgi:nicotinate-nucleotide adenylyltransferase